MLVTDVGVRVCASEWGLAARCACVKLVETAAAVGTSQLSTGHRERDPVR